MSILEKEDALFQRWSENRPSFVRDGVADETFFTASSPSVLLLLKEVNDPRPNGGGWDLRQFIRNGARPQTWDNVARWVAGISSLPEDRPWRELSKVTPKQRSDLIRRVAAMNLKKLPGGHTTVIPDFWAAVKADAAHLGEQFALYEADLVICCGSQVRDAFDATIRDSRMPPWRATSRGVEFFEYLPSKHVIAYAHPEARVSNNLLYYGLVDAVREIRSLPPTV